MFHKSNEALHSLSEGEFEKAKSLYSVLLDKDPEDLDSISGYFVASFWDNRLDLVLRTREGKERGKLLLQYFSVYEIEAKKRKIHHTLPYQTCLRCILEETATHLKLAYQWEGANALDSDSLTELAICLIKIGDYKTALEFFPYSKGKTRIPPHLKFYLAEAYCMVGREKLGKETYLSAFLDDPSLFKHDQIQFPPLLSLVREAEEKVAPEDIGEYVAVLAWRTKFFLTGEPSTLEDIKIWIKELSRLYEALKKGAQNEFKLKCRIEQYCWAILDTAPQSVSRDALQMAKKILEEI